MAEKIVGEYDIKVDKALKQLVDLEKRFSKVEGTSKKGAKATEDAYTKVTRNLGNQFKNLGKQIAGAFAIGGTIALLKTGIQAAIRVNKDFELQMARVKAITGSTNEEFIQLNDNAKRLGATTKFTASQVGQLQEEFAKLGFSTDEILNATEATLELAEATGNTLAESANVAGQVLRAFGLDAEETQRVVDVMASSFSKSALNMSDFAESMKFAAPIARAAGIEIETVTALLGKLADSGLRGSIAGTGLKNLLSKLADENSALGKELGFAVKNSDDLFKALQQLKDGHIDLTKATELTDERSKAAFITLINGVSDVEDLKTALDEAAGSAEDMAEIMRDTLSGDMDRLKSAAEGLALAMGEGEGGLAKAARLATQNWTYYITKLTEAALSEEQLISNRANEYFNDIKKSVDGSSESLDDLIEKYSKKLIAATEDTKAMSEQGRLTDENRVLRMGEVEGLILLTKYLREKKDAQKDSNDEDGNGKGTVEAYTRSINQLNKELKEYQKDLKDAEVGSSEFFAILDKVTSKTKELKDAIALTKLEDALKVDENEWANFWDDAWLKDVKNGIENAEKESESWLNDNFPKNVERATSYADEKWQAHFENLMRLQDEAFENQQDLDEDAQRNQQDWFDATLQAWQSITSTASMLVEAQYQQQLSALTSQLESEQITREEYDAKRSELARQQYKKQKEFAIAQAIINTALGVTNAFATAPNIILGAVLAAVVAAAGAAEIATISSQPTPKFAEGGFVDASGQFVGRKHSQGGITIEAEGGEFITASKYAQPNKDILKAINSGQWEKYKVENIIAPAIEQVLEGGFDNIGASMSLQSAFNDKNLLKGTDRLRASNKDGFVYLGKKIERLGKKSKDRYV